MNAHDPEPLPPIIAVEEFRFLLERGYPKEASLTLVGNRRDLDQKQRHVLRRTVSSTQQAQMRRSKLVSFSFLAGKSVGLDAYNVIITMESALKGRLLLKTDDGVIRDIEGISSGFRAGEITQEVMNQVAQTLKEANVGGVTALFLSAMSKSGDLASTFRRLLKDVGISGDSRTERAVETILPRIAPVTATANSAIMDRAEKVFDLAGYIILEKMGMKAVSL